MVTKPFSQPAARRRPIGRSLGRIAAHAILLLAVAGASFAQGPAGHPYFQASAPTGVIGNWQLQRGGPLPGYFQPVRILGPQGLQVSLPVPGGFDQPQSAPADVGLLVGGVYRLRITNIPNNAGQEVFPTIEMIDRLYTPRGQERRFAIPIEFSAEDLQLALSGRFVTRVIYLEEPDAALPAATKPESPNWFDIGPGRDPLATADAMGRPMAILRMGGRLPDANEIGSAGFLYGSPAALKFPPLPALPAPKQAPSPAAPAPATGPSAKSPAVLPNPARPSL
jgi:hypothetical protein